MAGDEALNPDVVHAVDALARQGVLSEIVTPRLRRAAAGELVSIRGELQALLYAGVLLIVAGAGLLVKENLARIGPLTIALAIGVAAAACLAWAWRRAPAFGWDETPSHDLAFDYVLLLGALLAAADLAFVEAKFTPLGSSWPYHLLLVAVFYGALALRFDSKTLFSLALTSLAAWRGVRVWFVPGGWEEPQAERLFYEALGCGIAFVVAGKVLERSRRKAHFEPVAAYLGWILILGGIAARMSWRSGGAYPTLLLGCGAVLAWFAFDERRIGLVALGVAAAAYGAGHLAFQAVHDLVLGTESEMLVVVAIVAVVLVVLHRANRALAEHR